MDSGEWTAVSGCKHRERRNETFGGLVGTELTWIWMEGFLGQGKHVTRTMTVGREIRIV